MNNNDRKHQKDNSQDKEIKNTGFKPPVNNPKPFQQFSTPSKFKGGPPKSFNAFHRRLGK